jgi:hypothetical protein
MKIDRIVIYSKDIARLTGKSERRARAIMAKLRAWLGKAPGQPVTVQEYCRYAGVSEDEVVRAMANF